jgi:hypothetical protein
MKTVEGSPDIVQLHKLVPQDIYSLGIVGIRHGCPDRFDMFLLSEKLLNLFHPRLLKHTATSRRRHELHAVGHKQQSGDLFDFIFYHGVITDKME